jgi:hypothetical protein
MVIGALAVLAFLGVDEPALQKPPRPADEAIVAAFIQTRPGAEILQQTGHDVVGGDGRLICGVARISDRPEPFVAYTVWAPSYTFAANDPGRARPIQGPPGWMISAAAPGSPGSEGRAPTRVNGIDANALARKQALSACPGLTPPPGVVWDAEPGTSGVQE